MDAMSLLGELPCFMEQDDEAMGKSFQEKDTNKILEEEHEFLDIIEVFCDKLDVEPLFLGVEIQGYVPVEEGLVLDFPFHKELLHEQDLESVPNLQDFDSLDRLLISLKEEDDSILIVEDGLTWLSMIEGNHEDTEEAIKESPSFRLSRGYPIRYLA